MELLVWIISSLSVAVAAIWMLQKNAPKLRVEDLLTGKPRNGRRLFVILNPNSGDKAAHQLFQNEVAPHLERANIMFRVQETTKDCLEEQVAREADLTDVDCMVIMGGDGTVNGAVNGLLSRRDLAHKRVSLAVIPSGSGNGIAKSLGVESVAHAVATLLEGDGHPFDAFQVKQTNRPTRYGVLSVTWGSIAEHDYYSEERLRGLTKALRLAIAPILVIGRNASYNGCLSYKPRAGWSLDHWKAQVGQGNKNPDGYVDRSAKDSEWVNMDGLYSLVLLTNVPYIAEDVHAGPCCSLNDGCFDIVVIGDASRWQNLTFFLRAESGDHINHPQCAYYKATSLRIEPDTSKRGFMRLDGEPLDHLITEVDTLPSHLKFLRFQED